MVPARHCIGIESKGIPTTSKNSAGHPGDRLHFTGMSYVHLCPDPKSAEQATKIPILNTLYFGVQELSHSSIRWTYPQRTSAQV